MEEWMQAIKTLHSLYKSKGKYRSRESCRWSLVDPYRHDLVNCALLIVPLVIKLIGCCKNILTNKKAQDKIRSETVVLGDATIQLVSDVLTVLEAPFLPESTQQLISSANYLKDYLKGVKKYAESPSQRDATEKIHRDTVAEIDKLVQLAKPPEPREELIQSLTGLDHTFGKYLRLRASDKPMSDEDVILTKGMESMGVFFVKSCKEASVAIKSKTVQTSLLSTVGAVTYLTKSLREEVGLIVSNRKKNHECRIEYEEKLKRIMEKVNEIIGNAFLPAPERNSFIQPHAHDLLGSSLTATERYNG
eukprot:TRINITY_DN11794_c0_g1_i2.p1 TRINITY_DN11794_c0_g1~~TRINITY_DN11794_c0_g1_i2.p1  ORF type:complete len:305 (-),score=38.51 TRINITY_DN11794_c0_g1_i2:53-967(-)